jgi:ATP-binding cassette subfamily C (CFTR/MRP) protein 2
VNRDLKRLDAIARSPVFAHFSETLGGVSMIRAFGGSSTFVQQSADKVDNNIRNFYMLKASERWLMLHWASLVLW